MKRFFDTQSVEGLVGGSMDKMSIEELVYNFVKNKKSWVRGGEIEDAAHAWGHLADTAKRKARHLAEIKKLVSREVDGKVEYHALNDNPAHPSLNRIFQKRLI
ncbi:MAG: hypothetical protein WC197_06790 [Candidatus Gastranaerophilaceae bacterium]|jgi:hypothetical protein